MFLGDGGHSPGQGQGGGQEVRERRAGHPVMGGLLPLNGGDGVGDVGGSSGWMLCPFGHGREPGGARTSPTG